VSLLPSYERFQGMHSAHRIFSPSALASSVPRPLDLGAHYLSIGRFCFRRFEDDTLIVGCFLWESLVGSLVSPRTSSQPLPIASPLASPTCRTSGVMRRPAAFVRETCVAALRSSELDNQRCVDCEVQRSTGCRRHGSSLIWG
jgi:hypothetical protein